MTGTLFGVGAGPGDPELLTIKAARLIENARVIAYPAPEGGESFARQIAGQYFPADVLEIPISIPMKEERFPAQKIYRQAAHEIAIHLKNGINVVVLCQGDPFFYGSFMYLFIKLKKTFPIEVVPGVSSLAGCTAAAQQPLCARMESVTIIPAPLDEGQLRLCLGRKNRGGFVIVKVGRYFRKVKRVLESLGLERESRIIVHASLPDEQVRFVCDLGNDVDIPYFSTILVPGSDPYGSG